MAARGQRRCRVLSALTDGDLALTLNRIAVGAFFMLPEYHKLFNAERHRSFVDELKSLGIHAAAYTDAEIAAVANYAIAHFGDKRGQATAKDVADARP